MIIVALKALNARLQQWTRQRLPSDFWLRWPPRLVSGVLLVLIAMLLWQSTRIWRLDKQTGALAKPTTSSSPKPEQGPLSALVAAHLFGVPKTADKTPATLTPSEWSLIGLVVSADPKLSVADMVVNGRERLIHVGERLTDGSRVQAINATAVVLSTDGMERQITYALRPAPVNDRFPLLPIAQLGSGLSVKAPRATTMARTTPTQTLTDLRRSALAIWAKRFRHATHP